MSMDTRITRQMVVEHNLVDRYLLGKMDEAEAMAFEDYYAGDPETLAELETSAQLIDSLQQAGRSGGLGAPAGAAGNVVPLRARVRRAISTPAYGIAASFVAIAALALLVAGNLRGTGNAGTPVASINIPVVTLAATRGGDDGLEIAAGDATQVVFALDLGIAESASYTASLQTADGDPVWQSGGLRADALQTLTLAVPRGLLPAGDYRFTVRPEDARGDVLQFPFVIDRG